MDSSNSVKLDIINNASSRVSGSPDEVGALARRNVEMLATRFKKYDGRWFASYNGISLYSLLQPIVSYSHQHFVGVEALVRGEDSNGSTIMPSELFKPDEVMEGELRLLERLSRLLHIASFKECEGFEGWLFINLSPQLLSIEEDAEDLAAALQWAGVAPERVIVEVTEQATYEPNGLVEAVARYRALGCQIAIDDFGAGHSNFERIWSLQPDIVKLDRNMVLRANNDACIGQMLPRLVELIHQSGALVLAEGIETVEQSLMIWDSGADMAQGYLFGFPRTELPDSEHLALQLANLSNQSHRQWNRDCERRRRLFDMFNHHINQTLQGLKANRALRESCRSLLRLSRVRRCFVLDEHGRQLFQENASRCTSHISPLSETKSCNWGRRPYFRVAVENKDRIHISKPYLSVSDGNVCQTLSIYYRCGQGARVLCCDIDPD
ncbi:sensor domain-containing phosphodiesterase [Echinimonas agarilytica]|uniref:EAL domain-containing protein n=1 Tax=Echinimonas agarilytica TaxID=1215918 RepID=A0AA41W7C7_9GAMM|nr:EAL domain-containing protein [Echinimonas agarilytica]MCM2680255.1 EAL domain-containing protein [Echinimonas agarilytica]